MSKQNSTWLQIAPYLLGAILFFVDAARFLIREDMIGAVILSVAGILAAYMGYHNASRRDKSEN